MCLLFFLKGFVISLAWDSPSKQNKKCYLMLIVFVRNLQEMPKMVLNVWSLSEVELLQFVTPDLCGFGSRVKISHYIHPSNISSDLFKFLPVLTSQSLTVPSSEDVITNLELNWRHVTAELCLFGPEKKWSWNKVKLERLEYSGPPLLPKSFQTKALLK